jgi:serine/threonine-protein kinase
VYLVIGAIQRRQGKWKESTDNLERAVKLNPNDTWPLQNLFFNYNMQRQFDAAERVIDRAVQLNPTSTTLLGLKSQLAISARGDLTVAEACQAKFEKARASGRLNDLDPSVLREVAQAKASLLIMQHKYEEALNALRNLPVQKSNPHQMIEAPLQEAIIYRRMGQTQKSGIALQQAKEQAEAALEEAPNEPSRHALLARVLAQLGEKEKAVAEARRAMELRPESADAFEGPNFSGTLAEVYAVNGQNPEAIQVLDHLLTVPSELTVALLRLDPIWDSLRTDSAFQQMLAKHESRA